MLGILLVDKCHVQPASRPRQISCADYYVFSCECIAYSSPGFGGVVWPWCFTLELVKARDQGRLLGRARYEGWHSGQPIDLGCVVSFRDVATRAGFIGSSFRYRRPVEMIVRVFITRSNLKYSCGDDARKGEVAGKREDFRGTSRHCGRSASISTQRTAEPRRKKHFKKDPPMRRGLVFESKLAIARLPSAE